MPAGDKSRDDDPLAAKVGRAAIRRFSCAATPALPGDRWSSSTSPSFDSAPGSRRTLTAATAGTRHRSSGEAGITSRVGPFDVVRPPSSGDLRSLGTERLVLGDQLFVGPALERRSRDRHRPSHSFRIFQVTRSIDATTTRASTVMRSMPTSDTRTHASITMPLSRLGRGHRQGWFRWPLVRRACPCFLLQRLVLTARDVCRRPRGARPPGPLAGRSLCRAPGSRASSASPSPRTRPGDRCRSWVHQSSPISRALSREQTINRMRIVRSSTSPTPSRPRQSPSPCRGLDSERTESAGAGLERLHGLGRRHRDGRSSQKVLRSISSDLLPGNPRARTETTAGAHQRIPLRTDACLGDEPKDNASLEQPAPVYSDTAFTTGRRSSIRSVSLYFLSLL